MGPGPFEQPGGLLGTGENGLVTSREDDPALLVGDAEKCSSQIAIGGVFQQELVEFAVGKVEGAGHGKRLLRGLRS